jgi:hypothetical protein
MMKPLRHLLLLLGTFAAQPCLAAPTVSILPATNVVFAGEEFEVAIEANVDLGDLSCFSITLDFDPLLLEVVSSSEGTLFSGALDPTFYQQEQDAQGRDVFSDCVLGFGTGVLSPGELCRVRFKALTSGNSNIDIVQAQLRDLDRALLAGVGVQNSSASISLTSTPPRAFANSLRLLATPNPSAGAVLFQLESTVPRKQADAELLRAGELQIFDVAGRRVRGVELSQVGDGMRWDARDGVGRRLASGVYFVMLRLQGEMLVSSKLLLLD